MGIFLTNLISEALKPTMEYYLDPRVHMMVSSLVMIMICYVCISTLLQTKDDFRFIIPYMEFSKEVKGARPLVLDTSVVIDGRIADVAETRVIDQPMVVPRFVLQELQSIADSSDKLKRNRGAAAWISSIACRNRPASRSASTTPRSPSWPASARWTSGWSSWPSTWAERWSPTTTT